MKSLSLVSYSIILACINWSRKEIVQGPGALGREATLAFPEPVSFSLKWNTPHNRIGTCACTCVRRVTAPESKDAHTRNRSWAESTQRRLNSKTRVFISANEQLLGRIGGFLKWVLKLEVINILSTSLRAYGNSSTESKESTSRGEEEKIFWVTGGHRRPLHPQSLSKDFLCPPELFMLGLSLLPLLDCGVLRGEINSSLPQP